MPRIAETWLEGQRRIVVQEFISEDDLQTFEGWLRYQAIDAATTAPQELVEWQRLFEDARKSSATRPIDLRINNGKL